MNLAAMTSFKSSTRTSPRKYQVLTLKPRIRNRRGRFSPSSYGTYPAITNGILPGDYKRQSVALSERKGRMVEVVITVRIFSSKSSPEIEKKWAMNGGEQNTTKILRARGVRPRGGGVDYCTKPCACLYTLLKSKTYKSGSFPGGNMRK